ncbi:MAG: DUF2332 domain-containing protein, partial [Planctomycetes bacterium]|nr:DUF2332 domain-containing protein [Planctomycetota bacterium]
NLFLAAVHFLLLSGAEHELGSFYHSCVENPRPHADAFPAFHDFCLSREGAVRELMARRRVQTNEVRRCGYLFPAFSYVARTTGRPLALIEVGASGGLNLIWDRYAYDYGAGRLYGRPGARVRISTAPRGDQRLPSPNRTPTVAHRVGVDLHVPDMANPADALWLRSLIWPDQPERMELMKAAIEEVRRAPPRLIEGDAFDVLPDLIRQAPEEAAVCVFHCHTLNQFSAEQREDFHRLLAAASTERPLIQLSAEWIFTPTPELRLLRWFEGTMQEEHLANVDHHGRWMEWLTRQE